MPRNNYIENPEYFVRQRAEVEPIEANKFDELLNLINAWVYSDPLPFYKSFRPGELGLTNTPLNPQDLLTGREVLKRLMGPVKLPDGRLVHTELFTEHSNEHNLGIVACAGTDWKPTPKLSELTPSEEVAEGLLSGGVIVAADIGRIDNLWVLSTVEDKNWITNYEDTRSITDFEYEQLATDLKG